MPTKNTKIAYAKLCKNYYNYVFLFIAELVVDISGIFGQYFFQNSKMRQKKSGNNKVLYTETMNRKNLLSQALKETLSSNQIEEFCSYKLSNDEISFVIDTAKQAQLAVEKKSFDCALLSALVAAAIQDNSKIPVALIGGDFSYKGSKLFKYNNNLNLNTLNEDFINKEFDGHFWIEIGGRILDLSIFRTLYSNKVPENLKKEIELRFGENKGIILGTPEEMLQHDFEYTPASSLSYDTITGLIKGFFKHRLKQDV